MAWKREKNYKSHGKVIKKGQFYSGDKWIEVNEVVDKDGRTFKTGQKVYWESLDDEKTYHFKITSFLIYGKQADALPDSRLGRIPVDELNKER